MPVLTARRVHIPRPVPQFALPARPVITTMPKSNQVAKTAVRVIGARAVQTIRLARPVRHLRQQMLRLFQLAQRVRLIHIRRQVRDLVRLAVRATGLMPVRHHVRVA